MRRLSVHLVAALALVASLGPALAAVPAVQTDRLDVALRGYDDGVARLPAAGAREVAGAGPAALPYAGASCAVVNTCATFVPREQYHWFELRLRALDNTPLANRAVVASFDGFEGGPETVNLRTDASGVARVLRAPAERDVLTVRLELPDGTSAEYAWLAQGSTANPSRPVVIRGEGKLVEATIEILRTSYFWIDQRAVIEDSARSTANALVSDIGVRVGNVTAFSAVAYGAFSDPADVELAVQSRVAAADIPIELLTDTRGSTVSMYGMVGTTIGIVSIVGATGDGADAFLRIFAPPDAYRLTLRDVGALTAAGPEFAGVRATALSLGPVLGDFEARLEVAQPGLVLTDAMTPALSSAESTFARGTAETSAPLAGASRYFVDSGSCEGSWRAALTGYLGLGEPSLAIAHAANYTVPLWARPDFPASGLCA